MIFFMADFILFVTIILLTIAEVIGAVICMGLIVMSIRDRDKTAVLFYSVMLVVWVSIYLFVFSPRLGLEFCRSFINKWY